MSPIIYAIENSPPCRAVFLLIKAINLDADIKIISMSDGENRTPEFLKMNPLHSVPTMQDGDLAFGESHAIMTYLMNRYAPDSDLYPRDPAARGRVESVLNFCCANLFYAGLRTGVVVPLLFKKDLKAFQDSWPAMEENIKILDIFLEVSPYLAGDKVTIADLSVVAVISSLDAAGFDLSFAPNTQEWLARMKQLPYYEVNEKGAQGVGCALRKAKEELECKK